MPRYFTLQQAEKLLPEVERAMLEALSLNREYQKSTHQLRSEVQRVAMLGGVELDRDAFSEMRSRCENGGARLKEVLDQIHGAGCLVKDLETGLLDFPTLFRGKEVYLCWKLGESGIAFWHGVDEGFRGRKPIDREFLDNHRGDLSN